MKSTLSILVALVAVACVGEAQIVAPAQLLPVVAKVATVARSDDSDDLDSFTTFFRQLRVRLVEEFRKLEIAVPGL